MSLLDFLQSASNAVAGNVTGPVDLITLALRKAGVPVPEDAVGTSAWAKGKGLVRDVDPGAARVAGETAGILGPMLAVHYAPQIARSLLKAAENAAAPRTLNPQTGAIVWHGSPHKFDKFDSSKIGTGEGAQAYGHGLYLAESPDVAQEYQRVLSMGRFTNEKPIWELIKNNDLSARVASMMQPRNNGFRGLTRQARTYDEVATKLIDEAKQNIALSPGRPDLAAKNKAVIDALSEHLGKQLIADSGSLYKVDLPDEAIARMLDWDKPLSQQPAVLKALENHPTMGKGSIGWKGAPAGMWERAMSSPSRTGEWLYRELGENSAAQTEAARAAGIPGIRYLDGGSRAAGQGTSNYVVFPGNEDLLTILERNGIPIR